MPSRRVCVIGARPNLRRSIPFVLASTPVCPVRTPGPKGLRLSARPESCYHVRMASVGITNTERLEIRRAVESDRSQYVQLFMDPDFMVYAATGPLDRAAANGRFDQMVAFPQKVPFGKQVIIETSTASLIGYVGVDEIEFRGQTRLEFGYRLVRRARGFGYATEAARAILEGAALQWSGELLALVDPDNRASKNVLLKTGFEFFERTLFDGRSTDFFRLLI